MMINKTAQLSEQKQRVASVYNLASSGYDKPAVRFFPQVASRLVELANIRPGSVVLDAATGTGAAAIAASAKAGPTGQVIGLDLAPDMLAALKEWWRVTRPNGFVAFSGYGQQAFQPISDLFRARLASFGVELRAPFSWQRLTDSEACLSLLQSAGFEHVDVRVEQMVY